MLSDRISEVLNRNEADAFVRDLKSEYMAEDFPRISILLIELVEHLIDQVRNLKDTLNQDRLDMEGDTKTEIDDARSNVAETNESTLHLNSSDMENSYNAGIYNSSSSPSSP